MQHGNVVRHRLVLLLLRPVDHVRILKPQHRLVGRNHHDLQLVNLLELRRLGLRRARHAAQLLVEAKIILERDRGQRLVFLADVHALLGLDRLVQPVAPAPPRHQPPGKGVHDDHLAVLDHVLHVPLVERVRLDRRLHVVLQFPVLRVGNVADPQQLFDRLPALVRHADRPLLLVHNVVAGQVLLALARLMPSSAWRLVSLYSISSPSSRSGMILRARAYLSVVWSVGPEMISGVRASSIRIESTSSTIA